MAKPILVANWKNNPSSIVEAKALLKELSKNNLLYQKFSVFIAPPYPYLESVSERVGKFAKLAAQNIPVLSPGAHTGEITPDILKSFGVRLVIIGHSERRKLGETSEQVSQKVKVALRSGMTPLVCVGEQTRDVDGEHFEFLRGELKNSLASLTKQSANKVAIAYEPAWAIGKSGKDALGAKELAESVVFIRKVLTDLFGRTVAESIPVLYGGAVEVSNAYELMKDTGVRGLLIGRASLSGKSFSAIAKSLI